MSPSLNLRASLLAILTLLILQSFITTSSTASDILSPLLSPILDDVCKEIECGKGRCKASLDYTFGFSCECEEGWQQTPLVDAHDHLRFLPCVIPNCTLDYSCSKAEPPAPEIKEPPKNESFFDPCYWAYCGEGSCVKSSKIGHRCECEEGHKNLLNVTAFPCLKECSLGMDCARLGFTVSNHSAAAAPPTASLTDKSDSSIPRSSFLWLMILMMSLAMVLWK